MAQHTLIPPSAEVDGGAHCRHHWVIQPASGPLSQGICQSCGEAREFKNYVEAASWGDSRAASRAAANSSQGLDRALADLRDDDEEG